MRILKNLLLIVVILWGLLALLVRSATPFITDYRDELAGLLSEQLGVPVSFDELKARWHGIGPLLELHEMRIGPKADVLEIDHVTVDLDLREMLTGSPLDALRLTIDGMQLTLVRELTGQLQVEGIGLIEQGSGPSETAISLPSGLRLLNTSVAWIDRKAGKPPFIIDDIDIVLDRNGKQLDLRARLQTSSGNADLSAKLNGFLGTRDWHGETYLKADNLDVADLFAHYLPEAYGLDRLYLDLEVWSRWRNAAPAGGQGGFELRDLVLHPRTADTRPLDLTRASGRFSVHRSNGDLRVGVDALQIQLADHSWPDTRLAFAFSPRPDGGHRIHAAADYLRIEDVVQILQVRLPWPSLRESIEQLQPHGEIRQLALFSETGGEQTDWRIRADLEGVNTAHWGEIPGVVNISGSLHGQQDHLVLELNSQNASVRFRELFRDPLELLELDGRLDALRDGDHWRLVSDRIVANTPHIDTRTRLSLEYQPDRPLFLDLQTDFNDGDASHALRYYPASIMDEDVVAWLDSSIRTGRVPGGSALVYGALDDFPFEDPYNGVFQVVFDTHDLELDYYRGWPKLEALDAHVRFHGNQLDIELEGARIYDSEVLDASARIPSLNPSAPLEVSGRISGPLRNVLKVLDEDALRDDFGAFVKPLQARGDAVLQLAFKIPMEGETGYVLDGQLQLAGADLSLPEWDFRLSDIHGHLDFNLDGLSGKGIRAHTLGSPVLIEVFALDDGTTKVRTSGKLKLSDIAGQLPAIPLQVAGGSSEFVIDVDVPPTGAPDSTPGQITVNSELKGVHIDLPAPFGKRSGEKRALKVQLPISTQPEPGRLGYAGQLDARFTNDFQRVDVALGGAEATLGPAPGIRISGHLGTVDLLDWNKALSRLQTEPAKPPDSLRLDLQFDRLQADNLGIGDLKLEATLANGLWQGNVIAPNLSGGFSAAHELTSRPIQVDLQRLHLKLPLGEDKFHPTPVPDPTEGPDPSTLPALVLNVADLRVNDASLGQLRVNAQRAPEGLRLTHFNLSGGQLELESAGHWSGVGSRYETEWGGRISAANLGDLLVDLGYSRQVEQAASNIEFLLRWPGNPSQLHPGTLAGSIGMEVKQGRIVELDPGVTRVVGLLNLNALTRRLRLDFSDIYKKGYSFDSMRGDFLFAQGKASTDNFRVDGPSGRIDLAGNANLINHSLDQHVTVTPNIDATLPIAGTLAGGPVAGLAVLVVQKAMAKQVDSINRFEYRLTGPWDDPEVRQLDSGGTLSKLLQPLSGAQQTGPDGEVKQADAPAPTQANPPVESDASPGSDETGGTALQGLLRILRESSSHGADLPGSSE